MCVFVFRGFSHHQKNRLHRCYIGNVEPLLLQNNFYLKSLLEGEFSIPVLTQLFTQNIPPVLMYITISGMILDLLDV